jgi:hypothetical protein
VGWNRRGRNGNWPLKDTPGTPDHPPYEKQAKPRTAPGYSSLVGSIGPDRRKRPRRSARRAAPSLRPLSLKEDTGPGIVGGRDSEEAGMQTGPTRLDDACRRRRELQGVRLLREDAARVVWQEAGEPVPGHFRGWGHWGGGGAVATRGAVASARRSARRPARVLGGWGGHWVKTAPTVATAASRIRSR